MFAEATWAALADEFDLIENRADQHAELDTSVERLDDCWGVITGWGAKPFQRVHFDAAPRLRAVVHTAGSVKPLFPGDLVASVLLPRGIQVFSGADAIALNVAESTVGLMILASRRWPQHSAVYRERRERWPATQMNGQFLLGATVGLISASKVARALLKLLAPFDCRVLMYDPYLDEAAARDLGVELASLEQIFSTADIVSVHAPALPATRGMIDAPLLGRLRDGATFVNTSRGQVVDHAALLAESGSGRIEVALDVTDPEPLAPDAELWELPNVTILPHIAAQGQAGFHRLGSDALAFLLAVAEGRTGKGTVPLEHWDRIA